jgi:hypothetical protein
LTRDVLAHRVWKGRYKYVFCDEESIDHLFVKCVVARYIWGIVRNLLLIHMIF